MWHMSLLLSSLAKASHTVKSNNKVEKVYSFDIKVLYHVDGGDIHYFRDKEKEKLGSITKYTTNT